MYILLLAVTLLCLLGVTRRALEPECPNCSGKSWSAHSTQLHCTGCGWVNGQLATAAPAAPAKRTAPAAGEQPQYEICFS